MSESKTTEYLVGFDLGTSAMKAVLSDTGGITSIGAITAVKRVSNSSVK